MADNVENNKSSGQRIVEWASSLQPAVVGAISGAWSFVSTHSWVVALILFMLLFQAPIAELLGNPWYAKNGDFEVKVQTSSDSRKILNLLLSEVEEARQGEPISKNEKINYLDSLLARYENFVKELSGKQTLAPIDELYRQTFLALLNKDIKTAGRLIRGLYVIYPTHYNIDEIRKLVQPYASVDPVPASVWDEIYGKISTQYKWRAPQVELEQMAGW